MATSLSPNIHLMTYEPWKDGSQLIRLEHIFEQNEDTIYSTPVTINLKDIFGGKLNYSQVYETNLAANQWIDEVDRFTFSESSSVSSKSKVQLQGNADEDGSFEVTLNPMEIKTFVLTGWTEGSGSGRLQMSLLGFILTSVLLFLRSF